ncbi:SWIM zinc finger family protein [Peribacillus acanthi]|uniref:SWIM zinc finger family protein n=1 Tax=Peribacillus acanthi TaxID=2171554 RepID=UPI000D3EAB49|nr:SWIM zinc finger family protein [Peribacillus acanthi]
MNDLLHMGEILQDDLNAQESDDVQVVQRGLLIYRQGLVFKLDHLETVIAAKVQDVTPVEVNLDLLFPANSTCSCNKEGFCRHVLAVFFQAYEKVGSVTEWVEKWKYGKRATFELKKAHTLLDSAAALPKTYEAWKTYINESFKENILSFAHSGYPSYVLHEKWKNYIHKLKQKAPLEREWKTLYLFIIHFQTLLLAFKEIGKIENPNSFRIFIENELEDLTDGMYDYVALLSNQARPFAFDEFFKGIHQDTHSLMTEEELFYQQVDLYRTIWTVLLRNQEWRKQELKYLKSIIHDSDNQPLLIATIHLSLLNNLHEEVVTLLNRLDASACPYMYFWITSLNDLDEEMKALPFVEFIIQHVNEFLSTSRNYYESMDFVRSITSPITVFCKKTKRYDLLEKFYRISLPFSYYPYAQFLIESEQYEKWVELVTYMDIDADQVGTDILKRVHAQQPAVLLPLYHRVVEQSISSKNRASYKHAVRYLKKLRTVYKKLKQEDAFLSYINQLQESTKRLRAFQEELQRGKLIHV